MADDVVTFTRQAERKKIKGKATRVVRGNLREISNHRIEFQDEEATVEIASLTRGMKVYTEADISKAEAVSKEAVDIAASLLERAENAENEVTHLKNVHEERTAGMDRELQEIRSLVRHLEEENKELKKNIDEEVTSAKKKVYEKVQTQFNAGNKEFAKVKSENETLSIDLAAAKKQLGKEIEATKVANKNLSQAQKDAQKRKKEIRELFIGLIKDILPSSHSALTDALKYEKNDVKLVSESKATFAALKEKAAKIAYLQNSNRGLQEKLKVAEQAVKNAANVEANLFSSKNDLERELMSVKQNLAEQSKMNEELVQMLEKLTNNSNV